MARSFGRVLAVIWDDDDFVALSLNAQRMYLFLLSQSDLEHSGLIPLRERRWAKACGESTAEQVTADLKELAAARFALVDEDTEELLVRSLIRRDEVWKQPNVFKAAAASALAAKSPDIKAAIYAEVARLDLTCANEDSQGVRQGLLQNLEPFAGGSLTNGEGFARGTHPDHGMGSSYSSNHQDPLSPFPDPHPHPVTPAADAAGGDPLREDVERLCVQLADRIEGNGSKRPAITQRWRDSARLMLDNDKYTEQQIRTAIDWCQGSEFWRRNVMSMPKLREQYERLRLEAKDERKARADGRSSPAPGPDRARGWIAAGRAYGTTANEPGKELPA
jgi:hypothetical protein